jgi:hypothetical protein
VQVAETLAAPEIGRAACARFVRTFVRPHGIDAATTPILGEALERLAANRRSRARMPVLLYPLCALLWISGVVSYYPRRMWNLARKQWRIAEKKTHNARKRLRRTPPARIDAREDTDAPRRKVG